MKKIVLFTFLIPIVISANQSPQQRVYNLQKQLQELEKKITAPENDAKIKQEMAIIGEKFGQESQKDFETLMKFIVSFDLNGMLTACTKDTRNCSKLDDAQRSIQAATFMIKKREEARQATMALELNEVLRKKYPELADMIFEQMTMQQELESLLPRK